MDLGFVTTPDTSRIQVSTRRLASLMLVLTVVIAALLAVPGSWSDDPDARVATPYPIMLLPLIAILAIACLAGVALPAAGSVTAAVGVVSGVQIAGIALVASRDWFNYAGADEASYRRAFVGSPLAVAMTMAAACVVAVALVLLKHGGGHDKPTSPVVRAAGIATGAAVLVTTPVILCVNVDSRSLIAAGQFALWWSIPWAVGLVVAATSRKTSARWAALLFVVASVASARWCVDLPVLYGFSTRFPL